MNTVETNLKKVVDEIGFERLCYQSMEMYKNLISIDENANEFFEMVFGLKKMEDIEILYRNSSIKIKNNNYTLWVNFDLIYESNMIGYYEVEYSVNGEFIDEYLHLD